MNTPSLSDRILTLVYAAGYRPCKPRMILKQLELPDEDYRELGPARSFVVRREPYHQ